MAERVDHRRDDGELHVAASAFAVEQGVDRRTMLTPGLVGDAAAAEGGRSEMRGSVEPPRDGFERELVAEDFDTFLGEGVVMYRQGSAQQWCRRFRRIVHCTCPANAGRQAGAALRPSAMHVFRV